MASCGARTAARAHPSHRLAHGHCGRTDHAATSCAALAEQFQAHVRSTGLGIAYNFAVMVFGGFAPFFVTWLIESTGVPVAPAFYVMFGAAAGLLAAFFLKERARDDDLTVTDVEVALN